MTPRPGETAAEIAARYGAVARCDVTVCPPRTYGLPELPSKADLASAAGNHVHKQRSLHLYERIRDEVVRLHALGMSNQAIGDAVGVSTHTVRKAYARLGLKANGRQS